MRILLITQYFPWPEHTHGTYKRLKMFVDAFKNESHIDFLFFVPPGSTLNKKTLEEYVKHYWEVPEFDVYFETRDKEPGDKHLVKDYLLPMLSATFQQRFSGYVSNRHVEALNKCLLKKPDRVFAHKLGAMCLLGKTREKLPPVYFDMDDIEHVYLRRSITQPPVWRTKYLRYLNIPALKRAERKACQLAQNTFICSEEDKGYLSQLYKTDKITVIENGVPIPKTSEDTPAGNGKIITYVGTYGYAPNVAAAEDLILKIYPLIKKEIPDARLKIVGKSPESIPSYQSTPEGVEFTGFAESLDEVYGSTDLVCCPITCGAGTRIKIIEAASYGKAVISTTVGAEGLEFARGDEIIIRDNYSELASECVRLLNAPTTRNAIGMAARKKAESLYGEEALQLKIRSVMKV